MNRLLVFSPNGVGVFLLLCLVPIDLFAQSGIVTAGTDTKDAGGSVSYSVGQMNFEGTNTQEYVISPGVQYPYELMFVSSEVFVIEHHSGKMLICDNHEGKFSSFTWYKDGKKVGFRNYYYEDGGLNGVYYLEVTDKDGKFYSSRRFSYSLSEVSNRSLSVYPVPATLGEDIHFYLSDEKQKNANHTTQIRVFDSSGKMIYSHEMNINHPLSVSTSSFLRGIYIVRVEDLFSKLIVE